MVPSMLYGQVVLHNCNIKLSKSNFQIFKSQKIKLLQKDCSKNWEHTKVSRNLDNNQKKKYTVYLSESQHMAGVAKNKAHQEVITMNESEPVDH